MTGEYEQYHGAAIREIIVETNRPLRICASDDHGRVNAFILEGNIGIYIKHSSKRLPPWQFVYTNDNLLELQRLARLCERVWLLHVCGRDGIVAISTVEFETINATDAETTRFVRVDRDRNTMYRVNGTSRKLSRAKGRGVAAIVKDLSKK